MIPAPKDPKRSEKLAAFDRMLTIMDELRLNCPWDKKQTLESIRHLTIEEVYELSDAILKDEKQEIKNEIGDVFLHLIFYSRIASETNDFDIKDVLDHLAEKMIRRHPHIYGDTDATNEEEVKKNWEKIKLEEGKKGENNTVLGGVPSSLPPLTKASRIQSKARGVGFDWDNKEQVWEKVQEEMGELAAAQTTTDKEDELGDVLFSVINYARFLDIDPEKALEKTNQKFIRRFNYLESQVNSKGLSFDELSLEEMDVFWNEAKNLEK